MSEKKVNVYLFSYPFRGKVKGLDIVAKSKEEAISHVACISSVAKYDGVLVETIPVEMYGTGWFLGLYVRLKAGIRNLWHSAF